MTDLLRAFPFLRNLPPEAQDGLTVTRVERPGGGRFFSQGDPGDAVYGVLTGRVKIAKQSPTGKELILDVLGPGEPIGAIAVVRRIPMPATAVALEPTACLRMSGADFLAAMGRDPATLLRFLDAISKRLVQANASRLGLATESVEARIAQALLRMSDKFAADRAGELVFSQTFTRENLAELAGTTVESAIRVMSRWTKEGILRSRQSRLTVLQPDHLRRLAEGMEG